MIPKTIKIGSQIFKIVSRDPAIDGMLAGAVGYSLDDENLIVLSNRLSDSKKKQTLMHEILHCLKFVFYAGHHPITKDVDTWEHFFIHLYEEPLVMVLVDNPQLVKYLLGKK
jgi:hypothetical protein